MPWWLWVVLGFVLLGLELATPGGFFIAFFGVAGLVVGMLAGAGIVGPVWLQWLLFSILSVVSVLLFRKPLLEWMKRREPAKAEVDSIVGETAMLTEDLAPGGVGKAELRGTSWSVRSRAGAGLRKGQRCRVEQVEGLTLWVRADLDVRGGTS
jgi:membrane protein implicated in regulation of membrane protease activity